MNKNEEAGLKAWTPYNTARGFWRVDFTDANGVSCSVQQSSAAEDDYIWLGCNELGIQRSARDYTGWHLVDLKELFPGQDIVANNRMHLSREQVQNLLPILEDFAYANLTEEDVVEVTEVLQNAVREGNELAALRDQTRWIPVSERLPDKDGGYLVTDEEGFKLVSYFQAKQQRFVVIQDELATSPVAWMPLPEPYVTEDKDGTKS